MSAATTVASGGSMAVGIMGSCGQALVGRADRRMEFPKVDPTGGVDAGFPRFALLHRHGRGFDLLRIARPNQHCWDTYQVELLLGQSEQTHLEIAEPLRTILTQDLVADQSLLI
jgi:hypothetical protein